MSIKAETSMEKSNPPWRKRSIDGDSPIENKRPRYCYFFRLESESSRQSEEDTESVCSLQGRETELARDTSDTDTKTDTEYEVEIEYEVDSLSQEENFSNNSSSGIEDMALVATAAALYDSSFEKFVTDGEDSDNSSLSDISLTGRSGFWTCIRCKSENNIPPFQYCQKCFQDRKTFFPPRPRRHKKSRHPKNDSVKAPVELDTLRNCLSGLSQDSGIGSSQECPPLDLYKIVVPKHLSPTTSGISNSENADRPSAAINNSSTCSDDSPLGDDVKKENNVNHCVKNRKRQISESSQSDYEIKRFKRNDSKKCAANNLKAKNSKDSKSTSFEEIKKNVIEEKNTTVSNKVVENPSVTNGSNSNDEKAKENSNNDEIKLVLPEYKEMCIFCNTTPKNSIFLHGSIAHMCCCYKCAMRTWKSLKRCPICNRKVNNVVKVYTT